MLDATQTIEFTVDEFTAAVAECAAISRQVADQNSAEAARALGDLAFVAQQRSVELGKLFRSKGDAATTACLPFPTVVCFIVHPSPNSKCCAIMRTGHERRHLL